MDLFSGRDIGGYGMMNMFYAALAMMMVMFVALFILVQQIR